MARMDENWSGSLVKNGRRNLRQLFLDAPNFARIQPTPQEVAEINAEKFAKMDKEKSRNKSRGLGGIFFARISRKKRTEKLEKERISRWRRKDDLTAVEESRASSTGDGDGEERFVNREYLNIKMPEIAPEDLEISEDEASETGRGEDEIREKSAENSVEKSDENEVAKKAENREKENGLETEFSGEGGEPKDDALKISRKERENEERESQIAAVAPIIELKKISKIFGFDETENFALREVDLLVNRGEFVAIMGPSGCGKTTLLNLIGLLDRASAGEYFLRGQEVVKFSRNRQAKIRGRDIGFIFQNFNLIEKLTVLDNVVLPLTYRRGFHYKHLKKASDMLATFGLQKREYYFPSQLSGGQMQRVAIARALINAPSIILADEPTGNLDSENSAKIMGELTKIHRAGNTILMVTHNPELTKFASRVIFMRDGRIAEDKQLVANEAHQISRENLRNSSRKSHLLRLARKKRGGRRKK